MKKFWRSPSAYSIGIDFGTTMSRIAYLNNESKYKQTRSPERPEYFPIRSLVSVRLAKDGSYEWNQGESIAEDGSDVFRGFKLFIQSGKEIKTGYSDGISIRPEFLAARIIFFLRNSAANKLGNVFSKIPRATVTIPAEWNMIGRKATIKAAQMAGFSEVNLIEEPVAAFLAALWYRHTGPEDLGENVLVFDCGGGTLDIAVIKCHKKGVPIVIGRAMDDTGVAGEHIDKILALKILEREGVEWDELNRDSQARFLEAVQNMKHNLNPIEPSQTQSGRATFVRKDKALAVNADSRKVQSTIDPTQKALILKDKNGITVREYNDDELFLTLLELTDCLQTLESKIEQCITKAIAQATSTSSVRRQDVSAVILTGGSSYLRYFQDFVKSIFSKIDRNVIVYAPDSAIAQGAALYQQFLDTGHIYYYPTLALDTYLKYEDGDNNPQQEPLGIVNSRVKLPYKSIPWPSISVHANGQKIEWRIVQKRSSSMMEEEVEVITFDREKGMERLYLDYQIDTNGLLKNFRPRLFQRKPVKISPSKYHWDEAASKLINIHNISDE